ncbi:MAG: DUF4340 domain-containing protein [Deltaproteobacteria bacterium]|nr:DUF4340 domain-containing protein [Deltaproteobacteria bacterium]
MRWPHAFVYVALALVLGVLAWRSAPPPPPTPPPSGTASAPTPGIAVRQVTIESQGRQVRAVRAGDRWQVVEPSGAKVTSDLVSALLSAVLDTRAEPVVADPADLEEFGLTHPSARITLERTEGAPVVLLLGRTNPAETGIYGRLEGNPQIVLLGLNVRYYVDLVLR